MRDEPGSSKIRGVTIEDLRPDEDNPVSVSPILISPESRGKGKAVPEDNADQVEKMRMEVQEIQEMYIRDREEARIREEELELENNVVS